ncbi:MAG: FAD-dependent oxidoreductase [Erythrobacter sp.]
MTAAAIKTVKMQEERLPPFLRVTLRRWAKIYDAGSQVFWQFTDLFVRLAVAQYFFRSGLVKATDWDTALLLATREYPVSWMEPSTAAALGIAIELIGPVLLVIGLFTRSAAWVMGALIVVAQAVYIPTTTNLFLTAILASYVVFGAGTFSLDRALSSGLKTSAVFFAKHFIAAGEWLKRRVGPLLMLLIRLWLAASILAAAGVFEPSIAQATWLPIGTFASLPQWLSIASALLLIAGIGASLVALVLLFAGIAAMAMGGHPDITLYPALLLAVYDARGSGALSFDQAAEKWMERNILFDRHYRDIPDDWPHIVVVGAGFGGLSAVSRLKRLPVRITLIDKRNYHLFQPLLYQIATATLNPADIAVPIRSMFREDGNVRVVKGEVTGVDADAKTLIYGENQQISFDKLVIASGASHSYFGRDEWGAFAPGLKTVEDGVAVRSSILEAFEQAESTNDEERIKRLLTFVIVGAGPTGVELAGAIAELAKENVVREFRTIDPASARVVLVQSGDRILPAFPEELSQLAANSLKDLGVEIRLGSRVTGISATQVTIGKDDHIDSETVLWAAGVVASPAAKWLDAEADRSGRVIVDEQLRIKGHQDVFAVGDTALSSAWDGESVPGLAPAAKQAGIHVAKVVEAELLGKAEPTFFAYKHQGSLATIGRSSAVADFGFIKLSGSIAWWLWGVVHVGFLTGVRNRVTVLLNWGWNYFARESSIRLITEREERM